MKEKLSEILCELKDSKIIVSQAHDKIMELFSTPNNEGIEDIRKIVLGEYKKGNIVISTFGGLKSSELKEIIKQPINGLLYDLNRDDATILTCINDPKWINDYAAMKVIVELKKQLDEKNS